MPKFKAKAISESGSQDVYVETGDYATVWDAKLLLEEQYSGRRIVNVQNVDPPATP